MKGFDTYEALLEAAYGTGKPVRTLGYAPGARPIISVRTGGDVDPPVLITAGAHATEHAGVCAAIELIDCLDTEHAVYIIPSRDPVGIDGFDAALNLTMDHNEMIQDVQMANSLLDEESEVIYADETLRIGLIGDYAYAVTSLDSGGGVSVLHRLKAFTETHPDVLERMAGRRVYTAAGSREIDGAAPFERTYTLVISPDGLPMHLNRFFTDEWAPPETRSIRRLMEEIKPGLTFDNHETTGHGDRFHVSLRPQRTTGGDKREAEVAAAIRKAVAGRGTTLATDADVLDSPTRTVGHADESSRPEDGFYSREHDGAYWVDPHLTDPPRLGEGLNATDFAADEYGLAFTLECGMYGSLQQRTADAVASVQAGVDRFAAIHK